MKFSVSKTDLATATNHLQGAITDRSLAHIGLKTEEHALKLSSTDRLLSIYCQLDCGVSEGGVSFVPAKLFSDVVRELPPGTVKLESVDSWLTITAGDNDQFHMKIPLIDDISWREPHLPQDVDRAEITTEKMSYMIEQVQFCIAQESPRNYGAVGYLHSPEGKGLRLVGTDGFRLSYCDIEVDFPSGFFSPGVCVSKRALNELHKICGQGHEKIELILSKDKTTLVAKVPNYEVYIRLSAVKYPNYQGVVPKDQPEFVSVSRNHLQGVARRVLLAADKTRALQLRFSPSSLTLSSKTMGSSEGRESVELEGYKGPDRQLAVNGKFLTDIFSTTNSQQLMLHFNNEKDPVVIKPTEEPACCHSKHILVPIQENP